MPVVSCVATSVLEASAADLGAGRVVSAAFMVLLLVMAVRSLGRPGASQPSILSFIVLLVALLLQQLIRLLAGESGQDGPNMLLGVLSLLALLLPTVLAVVGLIDLRRRRAPGAHGRGYAIATLIILAAGLTYAVVATSSQAVPASEPPAVPASSPAPLRAGQVERFPAVNLELELPGAPWVRIDPKRCSGETLLGILEPNLQIAVGLSAEHHPEHVDIAPDRLAEAYLKELRAQAQDARLESQHPFAVNGIDGRIVVLAGTVKGQALRIAIFQATRNGYVYQVRAAGSTSDTQILATARSVLRGLRLIDARKWHEPALLTSFQDPASGVALDPGPGWTTWDVSGSALAATYGVQLREDAVGLLFVLRHGADLPAAPLEDIARAALRSCDIKFPAAFSLPQPSADKAIEHRTLAFDFRTRGGADVTLVGSAMRRGSTSAVALAWGKQETQRMCQALASSLRLAEPRPGTDSSVRPRAEALLLNQLGVQECDAERWEQALGWFVQAIARDPNDTVLGLNAALAERRSGRPQAAVDRLMQPPGNLHLLPRGAIVLGWSLADLGRREEAVAAFARGLAADSSEEEDVDAYLELLGALGRAPEGIELLGSIRTRTPSPAATVRLARQYLRAERIDEGLGLLREHAAEAPEDLGRAFQLIAGLVHHGRPSEALPLLDDLRRRGADPKVTCYWRGRAEHALGWLAQAKASFEQALATDPRDEELIRWRDAVAAALGQGPTHLVRTPIPAAALPASLEARLQAATAGARWSDSDRAGANGTLVHRHLTVLQFESDARYVESHTLEVEIMDRRGVAQFGTLQLGFDAGHEEIFLNAAEVRDAGGALIGAARIEDCFVVDAADDVASNAKVLHVPVPHLRPGVRLRYTVTRRRSSPPHRMPYTQTTFASDLPLLWQAVGVLGNAAHVGFDLGAGLPEPARTEEGLLFTVVRPVQVVAEPLAPHVATYLPTLRLFDRRDTFPGLAEEYLAELAPFLEPSPEVTALARRLLEGMPKGHDLLPPLVRHLQREVESQGVAFGVRARIPSRAEVTLARRYGDCKDQSVLLHQLCAACGLPSQLVLVQSSGPIHEGAPSLEQFDHMIVRVVTDGGERFVDPTLKHAPLGDARFAGLDEEAALVLEPGAARLVRIPAIEPDAVFLRSERAVTFRESDAVVEEEARLTGLLATWLRGHLEHGSEEQRRANMERALSSGGPLHLTRVAVEGLEDPEAPLVVRMSYAARGVLHEAGANRVTTLPLPWYHLLVAATRPTGARQAPLAVSRPLRLECRTTVHAPAGFAPPASEGLAAQERGQLISISRSARPLPGTHSALVIEADVTRTTARLPADRASGYAAETERVGRLLEPTLVFQPR